MILFVDEEVQGYRKEFVNEVDLKEAVIAILDSNTESVLIKKRVALNNSQKSESKDVP